MHRWLKMSKYFPYEKMNLFVYTPENPEYPAYDESLNSSIDKRIKIIKRPITEPYSFYKKFTGKKKDEKIYSGFINDKKSWKNDLAVWIRSNFFIPDARFLWIKPSIKFLIKEVKKHSIDIVISTGPPHSMHLIANGLKKKNPTLKWIADFRDPWTNIDFYNQLKLTKWADNKHHRLEKKVLRNADKIVVIGWTMKDEFQEISNRNDIEIITNGFDHADFEDKSSNGLSLNISHIGSLNKDRNPLVLWKALKELKDEGSLVDGLKIDLIGNVDQSIHKSIEQNNIVDLINVKGFVSHDEAIQFMIKSKILLLVINDSPNSKGILTGKSFEYLGAKRPILCIGPKEGDVKRLLSDFPQAYYIEYKDVNKCKIIIQKLLSNDCTNFNDPLEYSRKNLAIKFYDLCKKLVA